MNLIKKLDNLKVLPAAQEQQNDMKSAAEVYKNGRFKVDACQ
jgi:hypothetical protein